jgi:hypothetical protein
VQPQTNALGSALVHARLFYAHINVARAGDDL